MGIKTMANIPAGTILVGKSPNGLQALTLKLANRHGLVTGATGTGKTVTLQTLAEGFAAEGVPVFAADIKGDLSGIGSPGRGEPHFVKRMEEMGLKYQADEFSVVFWDLFGEQGHPIRATVAEMGPLLIARLLELNPTQEGALNIVFKYADDNKMALLDLKDLRSLIAEIAQDNALQSQLMATYGNISDQTIGAIQRQLLVLENQGAANFFAEPALDIMDFMRTDREGRGIINILAADKLMKSPKLYATFLLWMLSSTRHICCSMMHPSRCWMRWKPWCASSDQKAWASISSPRTRWMCPTRFWPSLATACSMRCALSRPATRRR
jgi:uncharacterized protein